MTIHLTFRYHKDWKYNASQEMTGDKSHNVCLHEGAVLKGDRFPALERGEHLPPGHPQLHGLLRQEPPRHLGELAHVGRGRQLRGAGVADLAVY